MNFNINFQKAKRNFMTLTFDDVDEDGKSFEHQILVGMPKKRIYGILLDLKKTLSEESEKECTAGEEAAIQKRKIDDLYVLVAEILSNNLAREKISVDWVDEQMNTEDIKLFLNEYVKFCKGEAASPN